MPGSPCRRSQRGAVLDELGTDPDHRATAACDRSTAGQREPIADYDAHAAHLAAMIGDLIAIQRGAALAADMAAGLRAGQAFAARL